MTLIRFQNRRLVVADDVMERTLTLASRAASSRAPVLLCGPSGTGKELIARFIHEKSTRGREPFVSVNCAAIPEGLMEAELFGYERGAFTGAVGQRLGKFELANGGTLLLDEVSEMSVALQAKLLRVLQEGEVDRLGARQPIPIDARIIATTNREPLALVRQGKFREDLFYRLNVIRIDCSALAGRSSAVLALAEEFLRQFGTTEGRAGISFSESARELLVQHPWPGNVRELRNAVERAVLITDGERIEACHLEDLHRDLHGRGGEPETKSAQTLARLEQAHIQETLRRTGGNRSQAAEILGISVRTLRNKLKLYGE